jgi:hypothetical protein
MKILIRYCGLNARTAWRELVEAQLRKPESLAAITSAQVTLEWRHEVIQRIMIQWLRPCAWSIPVTPTDRFWGLNE